MDQIGSITELVTAQGLSATAALGSVIGDEVAARVMQGGATLCDVILTSWAMGVDSVQAVVDYADAVRGLPVTVDKAPDPRCA
ncbi:hypothetical protein [Nocardia huaxiensis]|uniref:Uncharacterized protein n=1 Tax=Nocardia huaxiensis TaxID=2755382 RepID=A0A7D6Z232_9NOCA|nr:hypothetical protein [Nocardia huaxiensis]QLY30846.1 hypothetical protein H0264_38190 [Nocardia huaxiensis]UFS94350.1 hypothetical protein LPY97_26775 [Nocardia huaxiensis]